MNKETYEAKLQKLREQRCRHWQKMKEIEKKMADLEVKFYKQPQPGPEGIKCPECGKAMEKVNATPLINTDRNANLRCPNGCYQNFD